MYLEFIITDKEITTGGELTAHPQVTQMAIESLKEGTAQYSRMLDTGPEDDDADSGIVPQGIEAPATILQIAVRKGSMNDEFILDERAVRYYAADQLESGALYLHPVNDDKKVALLRFDYA